MLNQDTVLISWENYFKDVNTDIFGFSVIKQRVDEWIEANVYLTESTTVRPGLYSFDFTPYMREPVNCIHPSDPTRFVSIMKDGQSGFTTALVVGGMLYIIKVCPDGILFTASDLMLAQKTIEERFDPVVRSSRLEHLIRPNVVKRTNNRTGDTSKKKEFAGGTMTTAGTSSANTFRMFSAKYIFADDYDTAPKEIGKEGSPKMVMKTRQNSFGDKAKTFMISTPTVTQTSNIWEQFQLGTQEYWNWPCPACNEFFKVEWKTECPDGTLAGIVWEVDENKKLIIDSVRYKCPHCSHLIEEKEKYDLNLKGKWVATVPVPAERRHRSFQKNAIYNPPGFDGWVTFVEEWLAANPPGEKVDVLLLKTFNNLRLGLPFAEAGESPRVNELMKNTRDYLPGVVPDLTCERDGNGRIIMLTLACDLNGVMNPANDPDNEDVRLDWELLAHSSTGPTYSVDHGSIGTFKRGRHKSKGEIEKDGERMKWTLVHNSVALNEFGERVNNSVWKPFEELMRREWPTESSLQAAALPQHSDSDKKQGRWVDITVVDTGFGEKLAMQFVERMYGDGVMCFGIKGRVEEKFRKVARDTNPVKRSTERPRHLYIVEVNQMKDDLANMMKLRAGEDGSQPGGFMNFPQPNAGKYDMRGYFSHFESERRTQELKNGEVVGYKWEKKNSMVQNHFWDVRIYGICAPLVFLDLVKQSDAKYKMMTWEEFVLMVP